MTIDGNYRNTINRWAEFLLDTGKNNNLVSIKDNSSSCLKILLPEMKDLLIGLRSGKSFSVYDPDTFDESKELKESLFDEKEFLNHYGVFIKNCFTVLPYHVRRKPLTVFKNIAKKAKNYHDETGINILYISFGSIYWKENRKQETEFCAPILLVPVEIRKQNLVSPCSISIGDDEVTVNPTFSYMLEKITGERLPEFDDEDLSVYLEKVERTISGIGWRIESECRIG